jgi:hypothetical protein
MPAKRIEHQNARALYIDFKIILLIAYLPIFGATIV